MTYLKTNKVIDHHKSMKKDPNNGFYSWEHCYKAFENIEQDETLLALHLGFYLASWGMYRGSAPISTKDYTIHLGAIRIIKDYYHLRCYKNNELKRESINEVLSLCNDLYDHYYNFTYYPKNKAEKRKPTDTLISKIVIGTLGCLPAFDRYFRDGVKANELKFNKINFKSLISKINTSLI